MSNKAKNLLAEGGAPPTETVQCLLSPVAARNGETSTRTEITIKVHSAANGKQFLLLNFQSIRQENEFFIRHATQLSLYFRDGVFANIPTNPRATRRQHSLGPTLAVANFSNNGTDNILRNRFSHSFALTVCERAVVFLPISEGTHMPRMGNHVNGGTFKAKTRL
jgi:hypothetical protein